MKSETALATVAALFVLLILSVGILQVGIAHGRRLQKQEDVKTIQVEIVQHGDNAWWCMSPDDYVFLALQPHPKVASGRVKKGKIAEYDYFIARPPEVPGEKP